MVQSEYTFPQDFGTGSAYSGQSGDTGDNNDAARFGALVGATQPVSCIINGLTFSNVDFTNLIVDIDSGKFYAVADDVGVATANESRDDVAHVNGHTGTTGLSLTDSAVNHVYAYADLDVKDDVKIDINTTNTSPSHPSVKIGEIDTTDNTVSEQWNFIRADGTLSYPDIHSASESISTFSDGVSVYVRDQDQSFIVKSGELRSRGSGLSDGLIAMNETVTVRANERESVGGTVTVNGTLTVDGQTVLHGPISGDGVITGDGTVGLTDAISDSVEPIEPDISVGVYQMLSGWTTENTTSDSDSFDAYQFPINSALEVEQNESLTFEKQ